MEVEPQNTPLTEGNAANVALRKSSSLKAIANQMSLQKQGAMQDGGGMAHMQERAEVSAAL